MDKDFTGQDSMRIINEMITQARNNHKKGAGSYCIFWGYFIAALSLLNFILSHLFMHIGIEPVKGSYTWFITIPVAIVYYIYIKNRAKKEKVITHIDRIIYNTWVGFGISCLIFLFVLNLFSCYYKTGSTVMLITPFILLLVGLAQFASATALRYKLYYYSACIFWLGSLLSIIFLLLFERGDLQFIVLSVCMILGFCIPGHMLNHKAGKNV